MIAAASGKAAYIQGDGRHTAAELIELQLNSDPQRGDEETAMLMPIELNNVTAAVLEQQGWKLDDVIPAGGEVMVRHHDSLEENVTHLVHPSICEHAVLAAQVIGLDIAGIDLVAADISRPLEEQRGMFVEVNAGPGLRMHLQPTSGAPAPVGEAIVDHLFPPGENGRIPIISVTGTNGKTTTCRILGRILKEAGRRVGMATSDGVAIEGRTIDVGDCAGPRSAKNVLMNPGVDAGVFESARGGILREGLGFDQCDIAVVTNIAGADHLGQWDLHTPEDMFKVKRSPVDVVLPSGAAVLNAADPLVMKMAPLSAGRVILFGRDRNLPAIREHRGSGKPAVIADHGSILLCEGETESPLLRLSEVPCTHGGRIGFQVENVLAATAAAWGLGLPREQIQTGLRAFQGNIQDDPARFNVFEVAGKTLIVVDCRNTSALAALIDALPNFPHRIRSVVYSGEEDRRDQDMIEQGRLLGGAFDRIVLCRIEEEGRADGDVIELLQQGIEEGRKASGGREAPGSVGEQVHVARGLTPPAQERVEGRVRVDVVPDWSAAVDLAWRRVSAGELLVVQSSTIAKTVRKIESVVGVEFAEVPRLASA
jgi:cyanophycin synthetase